MQGTEWRRILDKLRDMTEAGDMEEEELSPHEFDSHPIFLTMKHYIWQVLELEQQYNHKDFTSKIYNDSKTLSRNIFTGSKEYIGLGPIGKVGSDPSHVPSMRVGDCIAIISNSNVPFILRLGDDGSYSIIGTTHIGALKETPLFKERKNLPFEPMRIR